MAEAPLPHLRLPAGEAVEFTNPQTGRDKPRRIPTRNRSAHAASLLTQLDVIERERKSPVLERAPGARGHLVTADAETGFDLKPESLADSRTGIALVAVQEDRAIVHVRNDDISALRRKITDY